MATIAAAAGQYAAVVARVTRLNADCTYATGADNAIVSRSWVRWDAQPERETGEVYEITGADGDKCFSIRQPDTETRMTFTSEWCVRNPALIEMMTPCVVATNAGGEIIGVERPQNVTTPSPFTLEIWANVGSGTSGRCLPTTGVESFGNWYFAYPYCTGLLGGHTIENGAATFEITGFIEANQNFNCGPFQDYPDPTGMDDATMEAIVAYTGALPTPSDAACVTVPATAGTC